MFLFVIFEFTHYFSTDIKVLLAVFDFVVYIGSIVNHNSYQYWVINGIQLYLALEILLCATLYFWY